jgi:MFS-type transporter involved in bile tolerance (Atg22 family)
MEEPTSPEIAASVTTDVSPEGLGISRRGAMRFIVLFGVVSLFADAAYEGARSVTGPFLATLGASGTVVGIVAGLGELMGYGLRLFSGMATDRTRRYWRIAFFGYFLQLPAVPLIAVSGAWPVAAVFIIAERTGKAIRSPARDTMLSDAAHSIGQGWGFGIHEALDQTGAMIGPLLVAAAVAINGGYRAGFIILTIPAVLGLATLMRARATYPNPHDLQSNRGELPPSALPRTFWLFLAAGACIAAGYADFPLIAFRFQKHNVMSPGLIPLYYTAGMGAAGVGALGLGRIFDRLGVPVITVAVTAAAVFAPLVFFGGAWVALVGVILWGLGLGVQGATIRAAIAPLVSPDKKGTAFGIFDTGFGLSWFAGSVVLGILYDVSIPALVGFSMVAQLAGVTVLVIVKLKQRAARVTAT